MLKYHIKRRADRSTRRKSTSTTSAPRCRPSMPFTTTATPCTPTHTTKPSLRPLKRVSVAMAIQLIINKELGLAKNENPLQGSFIIEQLTDLVEEAVLSEFDRITERGGVLGAMETMYQRSRIQEESLHYEMLKHTGEYPIVGVNTFLSKEGSPPWCLASDSGHAGGKAATTGQPWSASWHVCRQSQRGTETCARRRRDRRKHFRRAHGSVQMVFARTIDRSHV